MGNATDQEVRYALLSLPQDSLKCGGWGSAKPVPVQYILDETEIANVNQAISDYNGAIQQLILDMQPDGAVNLIMVDMITKLYGLRDGLVFDGVKFNNAFVTGNFYSTDGLNPSFRGNALYAYYFIEAINKGFDAKLPQVTIGDYAPIPLP